MEVTCEHCKTKLNIPDAKIPKGQTVKISCPKCKNKITLDTRERTEKKPPPDSAKSKPLQERAEQAYDYADYSEDETLGFYEEGTKLALIMESDPERSEKIKIVAEELGYKHISAPNTRDAVGKMRFHHFDLIILSDGFDGQKLEHSPILNHLNHVSMSVRRQTFVGLLGDKFKTMDNMMAFAMSANLVINWQDMEKLSGILKKAISENERFYKVFNDTLVEVGKA